MTTHLSAVKPVVTGYDTGGCGDAALGAAARQAQAWHAPLRVLVQRPMTWWTNPTAMAPYPPAVFADEQSAADLARDAVARLRRDHPDTEVTLHGTGRPLARALLREAVAATMLVAGREATGLRATTRLAGRAGCPVLAVPAHTPAPDGPVVLAGIDAPGDAAEFAMREASARGVPLLACDLGSGTSGGFAGDVDRTADHHPSVDVRRQAPAELAAAPASLLVLRTPAHRRDAAWPILAGLLRDAPYPVATVPAAR